ncbi:unnamed protein product [Rangifer tarandus platyrhynchus]|uniref:Uncharacterized protein n=1 Tax=Rangifer tarandus platyrhynchus TaxID=3082113 RepID=A0AC59ZMH1_RANTA
MDTPGLLAGSCHTAWDVQLHTGLHSPGCFLCSFQDLCISRSKEAHQQPHGDAGDHQHLLETSFLQSLQLGQHGAWMPWQNRDATDSGQQSLNEPSSTPHLLLPVTLSLNVTFLSLYLDAWGMLLCLTKPHSEEWGRAGALCSSITLWFLLLSLWETSPGSAVPKSSVPCAPEETVIQKILDFVASLLWLSKALLFKP